MPCHNIGCGYCCFLPRKLNGAYLLRILRIPYRLSLHAKAFWFRSSDRYGVPRMLPGQTRVRISLLIIQWTYTLEERAHRHRILVGLPPYALLHWCELRSRYRFFPVHCRWISCIWHGCCRYAHILFCWFLLWRMPLVGYYNTGWAGSLCFHKL